jgi:hypothetical protein
MGTKSTNIFHSKALPKFTQIGNFGLKKYHLATLRQTDGSEGEREKETFDF